MENKSSPLKSPPKNDNDATASDSNDSEWGLEIVIKSTPKRRKRKTIDPKDKEIIESFEKTYEDTLEEKAAKSNLSHSTVKSILKHVFSDESVLALVKQKAGCEEVEGIIPYEPKLTRSKAKELYSDGGSVMPLPWQPKPSQTSEVQALLTEDLQEDSSGDEYVPGEEESEDDVSFSCSVSDRATPHPAEHTPNHSFTDDEIFKTPQPKDKPQQENENNENIALRTRSKYSLSQTPLEKIEQAFIPPDITPEMYEMDCNDEDWKEFLKAFNEPLEEVVKNEDEDHDPEYNFLSDEEIDKAVDKEELRADKAVKVPKKELSDLMAELFEYVDIYSKGTEAVGQNGQEQLIDSFGMLDSTFQTTQNSISEKNEECNNEHENRIQETNNNVNGEFTQDQLFLLEQQMCQHVQILTQNFILTYEHPVFSLFSTVMKEYLLSFKFLSEETKNLVFKCSNLESALELIDKWEKLFINDDEKAIETKTHFDQIMSDSIEAYSKGDYCYHLPFPPLVLETISNSDVFIYPNLLPKIPFKHPRTLEKCSTFTLSEYQLIALALEQFIPHFGNDKEFLTPRKQLNLKKMAELVCNVVLTGREPNQVYRQICEKRRDKDLKNPITYYFLKNKAPLSLHQMNPSIYKNEMPPKKRPPESLPRQWRKYIYPDLKEDNVTKKVEKEQPKPVSIYSKSKTEILKPLRQILPKSVVQPVSNRNLLADLKKVRYCGRVKDSIALKKKFLKCFRKTITYSKYYLLRSRIDEFSLNGSFIMLPSMPCLNLSFFNDESLGSSALKENEPVKDSNSENLTGLSDERLEPLKESDEQSESCNVNDDQNGEKIEQSETPREKEELVELPKLKNVENENTNPNCEVKEITKDNVDEINALMVASTTVRNVRDRKDITSVADKKKAKRKKEYLASLAMLSPPDPAKEKDRREQFAQAYFEKLKDTLSTNDYDKVKALFHSTDLKSGNAVDLFRKLNPILQPKYQDLADEFLLFLNAEQANAVGKLIPFFIMNHMVKFLRNLEIYFREQPSQLKKIYKSFSDLHESGAASLEKIKSTVLPLLKGNPLLCDSFLQIFLEESPTATLLNGAWEMIDVNKELGLPDDEAVFESITVGDIEDTACNCYCHKIDEQQSLKQHCINCGIRFIQGKIYCQTGKGLKPVKISFPFDPDIDHNARLAAQGKIKRSDQSPNKKMNISPCKETRDENKLHNESEEDKKNLKGCKSSKKAKPKPRKISVIKDKEVGSKPTKNESPKRNGSDEILPSKGNASRRNRTKSTKVNDEKNTSEQRIKPGASSGQLKRLIDDDVDWKNLPSPEYLDIQSSDSELDEHKSTLKNESNIDDKASCNMWTREEDKIILETFQQESDRQAIHLISQKLINRSVDEIRLRFERLMALLQEMENS